MLDAHSQKRTDKHVGEKSIFGFDLTKAWDYENGFYITSSTTRLAKAIIHWELYKKIVGIPGDIIECGTFKGASFIRFGTYREISESQYSRKMISFDAFGQFPQTQGYGDENFISDFVKESGDGISDDELNMVLKQKGIVNYELVKGNIIETIPAYLEKNPRLKIALLHIDVDVYNATYFCLEHLFDRVVKGGIIILDDYNAVNGATKAVDNYWKDNNIANPIEKHSYYAVPSFVVR